MSLSNRERFIWALLALVLAAAILGLGLNYRYYQSELARLDQTVRDQDSLRQQKEALGASVREMDRRLQEAEVQLRQGREAERMLNLRLERLREEQRSRLYPWELDRLREQGLLDPVNDLVADLAGHPELIPYKGVLGGTMHFHEPAILILAPGWVLAPFDDGHISGHMLLEYEVDDDGTITWHVLRAQLP